MEQLWFDVGLGFNHHLFMVFYDFSNKFKVFINIHEYANEISFISGHGNKAHV